MSVLFPQKNRMMTISKILAFFLILVASIGQNIRTGTPTEVIQAMDLLSFLPQNLRNNNFQPSLIPGSAIKTPDQAPAVFDDVRLFHSMPFTFLIGEVFTFVGEVN